jgi:hypothetical protein
MRINLADIPLAVAVLGLVIYLCAPKEGRASDVGRILLIVGIFFALLRIFFTAGSER